MINDYRIYKFTKKETAVSFMEGMIFNGLIAMLFYHSAYAMLPGMFLLVFYIREKKRILADKRMQQMREELKEFLNDMIAALQTGRSMENAFIEAAKDLSSYVGKETVFTMELQRICAGIGVGEPLEKMIADFAVRSHMEELLYFAQVFLIGKHSGGNIVSIMKNTIRMLQERMDAEQEIAVTIAQQRLEFQIMSVVPLAIMIYLNLGAGGMMDRLYGNFTGIIVMTACLLIYGGCYLYGKRLLEFEN